MNDMMVEGRERLLRIAMLAREWSAMWRERAREGGALLEYALVLAFVAVAVIGSLHFLQPRISSTLDMIANSL